MPFVADREKSSGFIPDKIVTKSGFIPDSDVSNFVPDEDTGKLTEGLFGTSFGERSPLLAALREPAKRSREGLKLIGSKIFPKPETTSVPLNLLLQVPEVGAEFSASMIEPETAVVGGVGKALPFIARPVGEAFKPLVENIGEAFPKATEAVKRALLYRFGQPEKFKELAETRLVEIGKGAEKGKELGESLSKGLTRGEQLRTGQILKGGISLSEREAPLRKIAEGARDELTILGTEAVQEGLLDENTFLNNVKTYMPRLYREYETRLGRGETFASVFGSKPQKIIGKRFLKRKDIPEEVRAQLGEIKEPAYPVAKGIAQLTHDIETAKLFRQVAENSEWSSDVAREGFIQLTGTSKRLGSLANKYVHPEIARDINEMIKMPTKFEKVYNDLLSKWKFGKVVLNPATHSRNLMSNSILLDLSGVELTEQPKLLTKALRELKNKGKYFNEAKEANLLGHEFVGGEIQKLLDNFDEPAQSTFGKLINIVKKTGDKFGDIYKYEEQWFKLAKFISEREKGSSVKEATREAEKWLFNYNKLAPATKFLRQSPVGSPFITFTAKAAPRIAEAALENPLRLYKYKILFDSIENVSKEKLGISDSEIKSVKRNVRGQVVVLPFKDQQGNLQTLDLSYILPWGDVGESGGLFGLPPTLSPSGLGKPIAEVGFNKSVFTDKPIFLKTDTPVQKTKKAVDFLYKAYLPSFAPPIPELTKGGYSSQKLVSALEGRPDYFGRVRSVSKVLSDILLGLKVSPVTPEISKAMEASGIKKDLEEIKTELRSGMRNKSFTEKEKQEIKENARRKIERLLIKRSGIEE